MQIPFAEYRKFIGWRNSVDNFWLAAASTLAYARDRLLRRRGRLLANGNALVGRLLKSAIAAGVSLRTDSRVLRLLVSNRRITGVEVQGPRGTMDVCARQGVAICTGGFGGNLAMGPPYPTQTDTGWS